MIDGFYAKHLHGQKLMTAEVLYWLPDHPNLLQAFVWQCYDQHPGFPRLNCFLGYWTKNIDARLHKVTVAHSELVEPHELRLIDGLYRLQ